MAVPRSLYLAYSLSALSRFVKFCMRMDHKRTCKFCIELLCMLIIANMASVRNFDIITHKFKVFGIYIIGNYALKWITKFRCY